MQVVSGLKLKSAQKPFVVNRHHSRHLRRRRPPRHQPRHPLRPGRHRLHVKQTLLYIVRVHACPEHAKQTCAN